MKFTCLQENLSKGLGIVNKAISIKAPLPILSNVLIETEDGRLKLSAFNMETGISTYVGASVDADGKITVPAKLLNEFVAHLPEGNISGELKGDVLHLAAGKTKSKFNGMNATTYPELPQMTKDLQILELSPKDFSEAIVSVGFSAAIDDSRPILGGILLNYAKGVLTAASADGFRLSERVLNIESAGEPFNVVIPAKTLLETARVLGGAESSIKFALNTTDSLALFEADGVLITTRILPGAFPDYKKLIPDSTSVSAEFNTADLLEAVKLTHVFAKETNSAVNLTFSPDGVIKLAAVSQESGDNKSEIDASVEGDEIEMSFNARFLLDFLNNSKAERLSFSTKGSMNPGLIKPVDEDGYLHIIMPLRITN
ncbi:DNA polymerase III subunit beta [candidate division WWE3 bacterium]|jgi:DNA polymerase III subunit beta|nr:DNA polymerase III subunit beta [candidate division WWE3 bacterium]MBT7350284.1 DNA polymerase III subunit beta [candidate division WWE3 bacterium]